MAAAHQASIDTCERLLGRSLTDQEKACVVTDFKNGRIVGSIQTPLSDTIVRRQEELNRQQLAK
jgi:hypothetical protein